MWPRRCWLRSGRAPACCGTPKTSEREPAYVAACWRARGAVLFSDADLSTPIEEVEKLERALDEGVSVAIGSRALDRVLIEERQPWARDMMGRVFNFVVQVFAIRGIKDTQCGFKLFAADVVAPIFMRARIDRFGFDVEILALARRLRITIAEIPVRWCNSSGSSVTLGQGARAFLDPIRVWWGLALVGTVSAIPPAYPCGTGPRPRRRSLNRNRRGDEPILHGAEHPSYALMLVNGPDTIDAAQPRGGDAMTGSDARAAAWIGG